MFHSDNNFNSFIKTWIGKLKIILYNYPYYFKFDLTIISESSFLLRYFLICFFIGLSTLAQAKETIVVKVGGYDFPPFINTNTSATTGITIDLIKALNNFQKKYRFEFFLTSPNRQYHTFDKGFYDLIFFESLQWGWEQKPIDVSNVFLTGGEVYITKASPEKDQTYFDNLAGKSKTGILGYHYGFANFDANPEKLKQTYQMELLTDHKLMIDKVITGQVDIAVVTASYLSYYLKESPFDIPRLLISKKYDQKYRHTALVRKGIKPDVNEINQLLDDMKKSGALKKIWKKYGIQNLESKDPKNTLNIGVSFAIPPYVIKETNQGIELEILREAFDVTDHIVNINYLPLARTFTQLDAGEIDGVINIKKGMIKTVYYSDEVITFRNCAISLAKKGYPDSINLSFLKGKYIIAFQRAPTILGADFAAIAHGNDKYEEVADQEKQVTRLFLDRRADFIIMEEQIFNFYRKKILLDRIIGRQSELPVRFHYIFPPTRYRFAFRQKEIRDAFNHGLKTIRANKKYSQIITRYERLMSVE